MLAIAAVVVVEVVGGAVIGAGARLVAATLGPT